MDPSSRNLPTALASDACEIDSADRMENVPPGLRGASGWVAAVPGRHDGGNGSQSGHDDSSSGGASGHGGTRHATGAAGSSQAATQGPQARTAPPKEQSIEAKLRREYDTELAVLRRRRQERKAGLCDQTQQAVQRRDEAMVRVLHELLSQADSDFDVLEEALRQRISDAWVAQAPASAKAPRPGARTPAEQREVNQLLKVLQVRRDETRRQYQDSLRSSSLLGAMSAVGLMKERFHNLEDQFQNQELNLLSGPS